MLVVYDAALGEQVSLKTRGPLGMAFTLVYCPAPSSLPFSSWVMGREENFAMPRDKQSPGGE